MTASPVVVFPLLAAFFLLAALLEMLRQDRRQGRIRAWLLLALSFGAVAAWLHGR